MQSVARAKGRRKLRRGDLLPGRLLTYELGPLTASELGGRFERPRALQAGLVPRDLPREDPNMWEKLLRSYATTYL